MSIIEREREMDVDFMANPEGVGRDILCSRLRAMASEIHALRRHVRELNIALTEVQTTSTRQCLELREHRKEAKLSGTREGTFLLEAHHELTLARVKHPDHVTLDRMICVLAEEAGEAARALVHREGHSRIREELAQTAGVCTRIAVEYLETP
jgi:hypothetical protein